MEGSRDGGGNLRCEEPFGRIAGKRGSGKCEAMISTNVG